MAGPIPATEAAGPRNGVVILTPEELLAHKAYINSLYAYRF